MSQAANRKPLSHAKVGMGGVISTVAVTGGAGGDLERRLLEMGFVEGARVQLIHQGLFRCPIAVKLDDMRVALRRREAAHVLIDFDAGPSGRAS
jgi:ferrous iron transport protein A